MAKAEDDVKERRSYPRVKKLYLVSYVNKEGGREVTPVSTGRTLDISQSGVRVEVYEQITVNSEMEMEIDTAKTSISVDGTVVRTTQSDNKVYVLGIQFHEVQQELANLL